MSWSLGEIRALSVKAARGAGMDWGMAEESGFAVEWLEKNGLQGSRAMAQYLMHISKLPEFDYQTCPLRMGCLISDTDDWRSTNGKKCLQPILILPFLTLLKDRNSILVSWENNQICITERTVSTNIQHRLFASDLKQPSTIKLKADETEGVILEPQSRVFDSAEPYIKILTNFAHKTYAPATEASRLAGAGAGLNDND